MTTTTTTPHDLRWLTDRAEITDLIHRLGASLDEGRHDDLRDLLLPDATVRTPGGQAAGPDAMIAQARRNHPAGQRFQHVITDVLVDVDGDRAMARANLVVHISVAGDGPDGRPAPPPRAVLGETYDLALTRTPDGWRLSQVATSLVWLSGTVPTPPAAPDSPDD